MKDQNKIFMLLRRYQTGGPVKPAVTAPTAIDTWEGNDNYADYQKWKAQTDTYNKYANINKSIADSGAFNKSQSYNINQLGQFMPEGTVEVPEGATGFIRYSTPDVNTTSEYYSNLQGDLYHPQQMPSSGQGTAYAYGFTFDKPEGNYNVIEDPKVTAQKEKDAAWKKANVDAGIKGYKKVSYPVTGKPGVWDYELVPIKGNQAVPTDGTFMDYNQVTGNDVYKIVGGAPVASHKQGGLFSVPKFKGGGLLNTEIKRLVSFGNYLLSKERKRLVKGPSKDQVWDADLANHFGDKYKNKK